MPSEPEWRRYNRANWDERVAVHLGPNGYTLDDLRAGAGRLDPIEEAELPPLAGLRVLHLQCHFGADSLRLLHRGAAEVVGLDFSPAAIAAARTLADELGLADRARFVEADVYDAARAVDRPHGFDLVFISWGTICWLPDIVGWARVVAAMVRPGGWLYFAEGHPFALAFDDRTVDAEGRPGWFAPYGTPLIADDPTDYADPGARLTNVRTHQWMHGIGTVVSALIDAGLSLAFLHEHDAVTWRMFPCLVRGEDRLYRWPDKPWLPLSYSLIARKR